MSKPSVQQFAKRLQQELNTSIYDYDNENQYDGVLTISYGRFREMAERFVFTPRFFSEVEVEAARIGLIVAYGTNTVVIATDGDFAPNGWSEIKPDPAMGSL